MVVQAIYARDPTIAYLTPAYTMAMILALTAAAQAWEWGAAPEAG